MDVRQGPSSDNQPNGESRRFGSSFCQPIVKKTFEKNQLGLWRLLTATTELTFLAQFGSEMMVIHVNQIDGPQV